MKKSSFISLVLLGVLSVMATSGPIPPGPTGNFINNSSAAQNAVFNVSSGTVRGKLTAGELAVSALTISGPVSGTFSGNGAGLTGLLWSHVVKTGSNLSDLTTRDHSVLTSTGTNSHAVIDGHIAATAAVHGATSASLANRIVQRDSSGSFTAGTVTASLVGNVAGNATTAVIATNIAGGATGALPYQTAAGSTGFLPAGAHNYLLQGRGAAAPVWTSSPTIIGANITGIPLAALNSGTLPTSIPASSITATGVVPGTYGGPTQSAQITVGADGRVANMVQYAIPGISSTTVMYDKSYTWTKYQNFASSISVGSIYGDGAGLTNVADVTARAGVAALNVATTTLTQSLATEISNRQIADAAIGVATGTLRSDVNALILSTQAISSATSANSANTIVKRDGSGNFTAGTVTGYLNGDISGKATSASIASGLTGGGVSTLVYQSSTDHMAFLVNGTAGYLLTAGAGIPSWTNSTSANAASAVVQRDVAGGFTAGSVVASTITATGPITSVSSITANGGFIGLGVVAHGAPSFPTGLGTYAAMYQSTAYGYARFLGYDGVNYQPAAFGALYNGRFAVETSTVGTVSQTTTTVRGSLVATGPATVSSMTANGNILSTGVITANGVGVNRLGQLNVVGSATPSGLSMGGNYSTTAGMYPKIRIFENYGSDLWGFGLSAGQMDYIVGDSGGDHVFYTAGHTERMRIKNDGRVGIATPTPDQALTVAGNISQTGVIISSGTGNNYFAGGAIINGNLTFGKTGPLGYLYGVGGTQKVMATYNGTNLFYSGGAGGFGLNNAGDTVRILSLSDTGNLSIPGSMGIGTTAPSAKLEVAGTVQVSSATLNVSGTGAGITTTGDVTAVAFHGNGSGLTGLPGGGDAVLAATQTWTGGNTFKGITSVGPSTPSLTLNRTSSISNVWMVVASTVANSNSVTFSGLIAGKKYWVSVDAKTTSASQVHAVFNSDTGNTYGFSCLMGHIGSTAGNPNQGNVGYFALDDYTTNVAAGEYIHTDLYFSTPSDGSKKIRGTLLGNYVYTGGTLANISCAYSYNGGSDISSITITSSAGVLQGSIAILELQI